ncbi:ATP-dependent DNA helicase recG [Anaerovibrio sp. JC8]|uniref:ATP-binding protein n=1 Tax=Anaerovibrio sp. JC8 TaxID=1240085 RepID=UPI000A0E5A87|nr:ATP-binding protein [Anaerovibrio sp. JC8]ORT99999.1 ATP-dependent DNA helicase recG [Anaerovibrio sp. JC8]
MKEGRNLEFKREITNSFLKTVSAFANFSGGKILFGVDDDGTPVGVSEPERVRLDIENKINDSINPKPDYSININRKTGVITIAVSEGKFKPYFYRGKAYRRSDTATIEVDQLELKRLALEGSNLYYEGLSCGAIEPTFDYFEKKLIKILGVSRLSEDILRTFGFLGDEKQYNIAAALFADENKFSGIDIAKFGNSLSEIMDRETHSGISILQQYDMAVSMYKRYYQYEKIDGIERKTVDIIPEMAFREAVANALVHRTWDVNSHIRISMFADRIEIASPGGLPKGLTKEEYINGYISNLRNPIIGNVFFRLHLIEMFGTGIKRIQEAYSGATRQPSFDVTENAVFVSLPCLTTTYEITTANKKVMEVLESGMRLSSSEIATRLNWSKSKTIRALNTLHDRGYIQKNGNGRGTTYGR